MYAIDSVLFFWLFPVYNVGIRSELGAFVDGVGDVRACGYSTVVDAAYK